MSMHGRLDTAVYQRSHEAYLFLFNLSISAVFNEANQISQTMNNTATTMNTIVPIMDHPLHLLYLEGVPIPAAFHISIHALSWRTSLRKAAVDLSFETTNSSTVSIRT